MDISGGILYKLKVESGKFKMQGDNRQPGGHSLPLEETPLLGEMSAQQTEGSAVCG